MTYKSERPLNFRENTAYPYLFRGCCNSLMSQKLPPDLGVVTLIGIEAAGKTTVSQLLAEAMGGHALRVDTWPMLGNFLGDPSRYAFDNQKEAMQYTLASLETALSSKSRPILADNCPDRIHLIHSWSLKE